MLTTADKSTKLKFVCPHCGGEDCLVEECSASMDYYCDEISMKPDGSIEITSYTGSQIIDMPGETNGWHCSACRAEWTSIEEVHKAGAFKSVEHKNNTHIPAVEQTHTPNRNLL